MLDERALRWYENGKRAVAEMNLSPRVIPFIEARGLLCHELLYLFRGSIAFIETPCKQIVLRILERHFPISPICRWYPSRDSILEWLGDWGQPSNLKQDIYRLTQIGDPIAIFFVEHTPEADPPGWHIPLFYKCPRLKLDRICRPPFESGYDSSMYKRLLRQGAVKKYWKPLVSEEAITDINFRYEIQANRGMWEVLSNYRKG